MKKYVLLVLLIVLLPLVQAKTSTVSLTKGQNYVIENINITLIDFNDKDEKAIICVNNERYILNEDEEKRVNGVLAEVRSINPAYAELRLEADCEDCEISDNKDCFPEEVKEVKKPAAVNKTNEAVNATNNTTIEEIKKSPEYFSFFKTIVMWVVELFR